MNLRGPVMLEGSRKDVWYFCYDVKNVCRVVGDGEDQLMQRSVNVSYPLPACPSDRRPFGRMAPRLTPRICIFRCSLGSRNRERPISRSNCESGKRQ